MPFLQFDFLIRKQKVNILIVLFISDRILFLKKKKKESVYLLL